MSNTSKDFYKKLKKEKITCPICEYQEFLVLCNEDRYYMNLQTVICNKCSLIYINPRPTEVEMDRFYKFHYRNYYESIEKPTKEYISKGPFKQRASYVLNKLHPYLKESKSFLDIGCAEGTLIKTIEKEFKNIKTFGVEPSQNFGKYAQDNVNGDVFIGTYQEFFKENKQLNFDVVATTHVLEHILNPVEYLKGIKNIMHSNSLLYIEVPNIMDRRVKGLKCIHLGHVLSFDQPTLKRLLNNHGFEIITSFIDDLPAKTPSMAVICKINEDVNVDNWPIKNEVLTKMKRFKNSILSSNEIQRKIPNIFFRIIETVKTKVYSLIIKTDGTNR